MLGNNTDNVATFYLAEGCKQYRVFSAVPNKMKVINESKIHVAMRSERGSSRPQDIMQGRSTPQAEATMDKDSFIKENLRKDFTYNELGGAIIKMRKNKDFKPMLAV